MCEEESSDSQQRARAQRCWARKMWNEMSLARSILGLCKEKRREENKIFLKKSPIFNGSNRKTFRFIYSLLSSSVSGLHSHGLFEQLELYGLSLLHSNKLKPFAVQREMELPMILCFLSPGVFHVITACTAEVFF